MGKTEYSPDVHVRVHVAAPDSRIETRDYALSLSLSVLGSAHWFLRCVKENSESGEELFNSSLPSLFFLCTVICPRKFNTSKR